MSGYTHHQRLTVGWTSAHQNHWSELSAPVRRREASFLQFLVFCTSDKHQIPPQFELHSCFLCYRDPSKLFLLSSPITTLCKSMRSFRSLPWSHNLPIQDTKHPLTWESFLTPPKHALYCSWQLLFTASYSLSLRVQESLNTLKDCE